MRGLITRLQANPDIDLQLFAGGTHLAPQFGMTVDEIVADGFVVTEKLHYLLASDEPGAVANSMALALMAGSGALSRYQPDLLVLLGDRYEALAMAQSALLHQVPIAHIHGGETTQGAMDEAIRHSITKMAHLHFTSTDIHRQRVIQLGESPDRVFNVGAPGLDNIKELQLLSKAALQQQLGFDLSSGYVLVTYHPATLDLDDPADSMAQLAKALASFPEYKVVITYPNADTFSSRIIQVLQQFQQQNPQRVLLKQSLGALRYLSALKFANAVVGNSSSGLIEAPSFKVPTVNIGSRQLGRVAGSTVLHCTADSRSITIALKQALSPQFRAVCDTATNPYDQGGASDKIEAAIVNTKLQGLLRKAFFDLQAVDGA